MKPPKTPTSGILSRRKRQSMRALRPRTTLKDEPRFLRSENLLSAHGDTANSGPDVLHLFLVSHALAHPVCARTAALRQPRPLLPAHSENRAGPWAPSRSAILMQHSGST